jgi:subtilisin family serine protease
MRINTTQSPATWGIDRVDQRNLPLTNSYSYTVTGAGVTAYVIDTGVRFSHNEFCGRAVSGFDAINGGSADDCNGHGRHVASTGGSLSKALDNAVRSSIADGVTYAIAAGNDNRSACNQSPARVAEAITVGATTRKDARSWFSNTGTCLDTSRQRVRRSSRRGRSEDGLGCGSTSENDYST